MKIKNILLSALAVSFAFTACDIERLPKDSMDSGQISKDPNASLESLLTGTYAQMKGWSDVMHRCGEYAGDNIMIRGTSTDAFYEFISYNRTPNNYRLQAFWDNSYKVIAQASNILKMVKEGQSADIDNKLGECYFLRGMNYFYLCRAYGRPYYQSPDTNLGVPIVNGTPDDILNAVLPDRSTVKETYAQAINDLKKAARLMSRNQGPAYASKEAAWALLSRVYLYMSGTWVNPIREYAELSVKYADSVINLGPYTLLPRADFMKYNTITPESNRESIFVIKRMASEFSGSDHYYGIGGMYASIGGMGWAEMYASAKYIDLLNETGRNDWRKGINGMVDARAAFIDPNYDTNVKGKDYKLPVFRYVRRDAGATPEDDYVYHYVQDSLLIDPISGDPIVGQNNELTCWEWVTDEDGKRTKVTHKLTPVDVSQQKYEITLNNGDSYTGFVDNFIRLGQAYPMFYIVKCSRENGEESHLHSPVITRLGEIYLNRAEALAKMEDYGRALIDLNTIRERSLLGEGYPAIDRNNAPELIEKERQLELAFQAERSYDVYRNGLSLNRSYPGPHPKKEVLPNDYRVVYFIPQTAINSYKPNILTQNPTSNE